MSTSAALSHLLLLIFASIINGAACFDEVVERSDMVPLADQGFRSLVLNETRRRLRSFQICALCLSGVIKKMKIVLPRESFVSEVFFLSSRVWQKKMRI
ncbi:hypothetical protein H6P81_012216 [Aristolochia fimbriata]|uniref:Uncharacterized protein n=1 Tax=Aristolochia fimbriata TaxID=158543 RepID=A0AAV7EFT2_ARIFI|nr:hypothetical protein H6P81_012216 [Aristolochia fimbriata]